MESAQNIGNPGRSNSTHEKFIYKSEATVWTEHSETDKLQFDKGMRQNCIVSPYLFNLYVVIYIYIYILNVAILED